MNKQNEVLPRWRIVVALFLVGMLGPMARFNITAFFPFISSELGWSHSEIGLAQSITLWTYSVFAILSGLMVDRIGGRKTMCIGGFLCMIGWLLLSTIGFLWQFYVYYGVFMAAAVSMTHLVPLQSVSRKIFTKQAGLAGGILASAAGVGNIIFMPVLTLMSGSSGWRNTSVVFAFVFGVPIMIVTYFMLRDVREDTERTFHSERTLSLSDRKQAVAGGGETAKDAIMTSQFWLLVVTYGLLGIIANAIVAHLVAWSVDLGCTPATSGIYVTMLSFTSLGGRIGGGWLGDRYGKRRVIMISSLLSLLVMLWGWQQIESTRELVFFIIMLGSCFALPTGLFAPYLGDLFGKAELGLLFGILTMGWGLIGGWGPMLWGIIFDTTGSYNGACLFSAGCYALTLITVLLIRPRHASDKNPQRRGS